MKENMKNIKCKVLYVMMCLMVFAGIFNFVNAYEIDVYTKRLASDKECVYYRVYGAPHPNKISAAILGPGNWQYERLIDGSTVRYNGLNNWIGQGAAKKGWPDSTLYYNTEAMIFHTAPLSVYPSWSNGTDDNTYYYAKYASNWYSLAADSATDAANMPVNTGSCYRPYTRGDAGSIYKETYPLYSSSEARDGFVRPYRSTILCVNCNGGNHYLAGQTGHGLYGTLRKGHIAVSDYRVSKAGYDDILKKFTKYATHSGGDDYYIYMSDVITTLGDPFGNVAYNRANNIGQFYNNTYQANGEYSWWALDQRGISSGVVQPLSSLINSYDNRFHFPEPPTKEVVVRYLDIAGKSEADRMNVDQYKTSLTTLKKMDTSQFTDSDIKKMTIKEETKTIKANEKGGLEVKVPEDMVYIGNNVNVKTPPDYTAPEIKVINKGTTIDGSTSTSKIYIDVFFNSKKRVYVRQKNAANYFNEATQILFGLTPDIVKNLPTCVRRAPYGILIDKNGNVSNSHYTARSSNGFDEYYLINVKERLEVLNVEANLGNPGAANSGSDIRYITYKTGKNSVANRAFSQMTSAYTGGNISINNKDDRLISSNEDETTYFDLLYKSKRKPPVTPEIPDKSPTNYTPEGILYFQSEDPIYKAPTANEVKPIDDNIPSGKSLKAGILNVYPYLFTRADIDSKNIYKGVSNGKNIVDITAVYDEIVNSSIFTLNKATLMDNNAQEGKKLFNAPDSNNLQIVNSYYNQANNISYIKGNVNTEIWEQGLGHECGGICRDVKCKVTMQADRILYANVDLFPNQSAQTLEYTIKKIRCKKDKDGHYVEDYLKTQYITPNVPDLKIGGYVASVQNALFDKKKPQKYSMSQMNDLYTNNEFGIDSMKYNGVRVPTGELTYKLNFSLGKVLDAVNPVVCNVPNKTVEPVIVLTPVIADMKLSSNTDYVDHLGDGSSEIKGEVIQKNTPFKVNMIVSGNNKHTVYPSLKEFMEFTREHYIKFMFDVQYAKTYRPDGSPDQATTNMNIIKAGTWIQVPAGGTIETQAVYVPSESASEVVTALEGSYVVKTVAKNAPRDVQYLEKVLNRDVDRFIDEEINKTQYKANKHFPYHSELAVNKETVYAARKTKKTMNLSRIYDFKITDVVDIDWKNVFRGSNSIDHTGRVYFGGYKKWDIYSNESNQLIDRKSEEIGNSPKRVLPVGPLKHTNTGYQKAVKLGYSFGFDLKTTGSIDNEIIEGTNKKVSKKIIVKPSYYYISKDGKTYEKDIELYYKNGAGKYIKLGSAQDKQALTMRPEDGMRYISQYEPVFNERYLSKNIVSMGNYKDGIELKASTNMATNNQKFVQLWYGSFKLPNSTVVIKKGESDLSKALTKGYIGVKFDITCVEMGNGQTYNVKYNQLDASKAGTPNTTQWDYEGYLGSVPGQKFSGGIQLESGKWSIDDKLYQEIRSTVMLYDTDERAAEDFETGAGK
ncbi:MAG: hypothetical protein RSC09_02860 [Clostridia bacterium]